MISNIRTSLICFFTFTCAFTVNGMASDFSEIRKESKKLSKALQNEDLNQVLAYIDSETMVLPEYHCALETPTEINRYYQQFFERSETRSYTKELIEILKIGAYFQEIGTFEHEYKIAEEDWFTYRGKYMTWWKISENGEWKILANIWGGNQWYEPHLINFVQVATTPTPAIIPKTPLEHKIVESINATIKMVKSADVESIIQGYLDDAIYMTYYDAPFVGKSTIEDYFTSHYNPAVTNDSLRIEPYRIIEMGDYSLQLNKYYVEWTYEGNTSFIHGKGLNIRKNMQDGRLKMFRQILNHSIPPTPKKHPDRKKVEEILSVLDNQEISVETLLKVFSEDDLEHFPPGGKKITSLADLKSHLIQSRAAGTTVIKHTIDTLHSYPDMVLVTGNTKGTFKPHNEKNRHAFETKNLILFKRTKDDSLKITKVIWNSVSPNTH